MVVVETRVFETGPVTDVRLGAGRGGGVRGSESGGGCYHPGGRRSSEDPLGTGGDGHAGRCAGDLLLPQRAVENLLFNGARAHQIDNVVVGEINDLRCALRYLSLRFRLPIAQLCVPLPFSLALPGPLGSSTRAAVPAWPARRRALRLCSGRVFRRGALSNRRSSRGRPG